MLWTCCWSRSYWVTKATRTRKFTPTLPEHLLHITKALWIILPTLKLIISIRYKNEDNNKYKQLNFTQSLYLTLKDNTTENKRTGKWKTKYQCFSKIKRAVSLLHTNPIFGNFSILLPFHRILWNKQPPLISYICKATLASAEPKLCKSDALSLPKWAVFLPSHMQKLILLRVVIMFLRQD